MIVSLRAQRTIEMKLKFYELYNFTNSPEQMTHYSVLMFRTYFVYLNDSHLTDHNLIKINSLDLPSVSNAILKKLRPVIA